MPSSGTYNFSVSNGEAVLAAFERVRVRAPSIRHEHMVTARRELNLMFVEWSNKQVNLFKVEQFSTALTAGTPSYSVAPRVVMILDAWISTGSGASQTDLYVTPMSRTEYASLAVKSTPGRPTSYWFDRLISPLVYPWPVPDSSGPYTLNYFACVQIQDANLQGGETPDVPYLWLDALVKGLAHRLAQCGYSPELEQARKQDAMEAWNVAAAQNVENVDVYLAPAISTYYRR